MYHQTKEGRMIPIACLEDDHLLNCIKVPFKQFGNKSYNSKKLEFLSGRSLVVLTPELYYTIQGRIGHYIIEALRRESTQEEVRAFLSQFNPIFETKEKEVIPLNLLGLGSGDDDDEDI